MEVKVDGTEYTFGRDPIDGTAPCKKFRPNLSKRKIGKTEMDEAALGVAPSIYDRGLTKYANGTSEFQLNL